MATSGMPMPAARAWRSTVLTSHISAELRGWVMTCAPVLRLAIHLLMASEMKLPPMPITAEKPSSMVRLRPLAVR